MDGGLQDLRRPDLNLDGLSYPDYLDVASGTTSFSEVALSGSQAITMRVGDAAAEVRVGGFVIASYFPLLGIGAALGRTFLPEEDATAGTHPRLAAFRVRPLPARTPARPRPSNPSGEARRAREDGMPSQGSYSSSRQVEAWVTLALCAAVFAASAVQQFAGGRGHPLNASTPDWVPLAAAGLAAAGIVPSGRSRWGRARRALLWSGLLLMVWATQGLPLDALRVTGLIPLPVDWPGLATKTLALAAAVVLAHHALVSLPAPVSRGPAVWYGYAAFGLALPYPLLRAWWALGGTTGLSRPGAAGEGYAPLVLAVPWLLAGALSLLLVPTWRRMPRRLLLTAGWTATTMVAMVGPGACWAVVTRLLEGAPTTPPGVEPSGISLWVFALFYGSWFLWAIAAGAATRSYQSRSARRGDALADAAARVGA